MRPSSPKEVPREGWGRGTRRFFLGRSVSCRPGSVTSSPGRHHLGARTGSGLGVYGVGERDTSTRLVKRARGGFHLCTRLFQDLGGPGDSGVDRQEVRTVLTLHHRCPTTAGGLWSKDSVEHCRSLPGRDSSVVLRRHRRVPTPHVRTVRVGPSVVSSPVDRSILITTPRLSDPRGKGLRRRTRPGP